MRAALIDVQRLIAAYHEDVPDPHFTSQRVAFGTSGHRGSALTRSFNTWHVRAITQALCQVRLARGVTGPLFLGVDTHALSQPAAETALEVLAGNGVSVMLALHDAPTPTPAVSHAILAHNRGRTRGWADGIIMTPSHNPPGDGGLKYNPPHGGAAGTDITDAVDALANRFLAARLQGVRRMPLAQALRAATTRRHDFLSAYVDDLPAVVDLVRIRASGLHLGVDPLGGAGVHYWREIAERHGLDLELIDARVDPTFFFVPPDHDGQIRMDPASSAVMLRLIVRKNEFDLGLGCDADHDRHGIVTPSRGLLRANDVLCLAVDHLLRERPSWPAGARIGKSVVTTRLIDRLSESAGRAVFETPVGFKWFAPGLLAGTLGFAGEESAGATFLRQDGTAWTTDKDGMAAALLMAEVLAHTGKDLAERYDALAERLARPSTAHPSTAHPSTARPVTARVDTPATDAQRARLRGLKPADFTRDTLGGEPVGSRIDQAPGNGAPLGGLRVSSANGWIALRPSGTEPLCKLYAESFLGPEHLALLLSDAQGLVDSLATPNGTA